MQHKVKRQLKEIEAKAEGRIFATKEIFITTRKVIVDSPDGGYEYKECEFVYVPNGNLKQSMVIYPITGDRSGQVLKVDGMQGKGVYVFDGYLVNERHCLSNGSLVKDSRISEEGLQYLSLVINEKRKK